MSDQTTVDSAFKGKSPWAPNQPSGTSSNQKFNCATMYGKYRSYFGLFDDNQCSRRMKDAGHICERAVSCTKHERGRSLFVEESILEDQEHAFSVFIHLVIEYHQRGRPNPNPILSYYTRKRLQTKCFKVMVIESIEGIRGSVNLS